MGIVYMILGVVGNTLLHMLVKLASEDFVRLAVVKTLEKLVTKTAATWDDEMLAAAKKHWEM